MTQEQVGHLLAALQLAPTPENEARVREAMRTALRDFLNRVWLMRQTQRRYAEGERSLLLVKQSNEKGVDELLEAMRHQMQNPKLL